VKTEFKAAQYTDTMSVTAGIFFDEKSSYGKDLRPFYAIIKEALKSRFCWSGELYYSWFGVTNELVALYVKKDEASAFESCFTEILTKIENQNTLNSDLITAI
jgi:hypothetical protein